MEAATYYMRDKNGRYLSLNREGRLIRSQVPKPVTGIPAEVATATYMQLLTFTKQARAIITRLFMGTGSPEAICFVCIDEKHISLNAKSLRIKGEELAIAPHSPDTAKRLCEELSVTHIAHWVQIGN